VYPLLRFEWRLQTRQPAFAVAACIFLLLGFGLVASGYGPESANVNSPFVAAQAMGLLSLPAIFLATVFCAAAALRDAEHGVEEIVRATPVGRSRYLLGRFGGAVLACAAVLGLGALGMALAPVLAVVEPERLGPADPGAPFWALAVVGIPNLLLLAATVFAVAVLTRSALASYVAALALYAGYFLVAYLLASPLIAGAAPASAETLARAAILDLFGISAVFEQARTWTPDDQNSRHIALRGSLLANRLLWLSVAAGALALARWRSDGLRAPRQRVPRTPAEAAPSSIPAYRPVSVRGRGTARAALRSSVRTQTAYVLTGRPFLALMTLWVFVLWANLSGGEAAEYGSRAYPTTGLLLGIAARLLSELGMAVVVFFSAELVWRERSAGIAELVDATPARNAVFYLSRLGTLVVVIAVLCAATGLTVVAMQASRGYMHFEPVLHLRLLAAAGVPLVLFAVAALLAQTLSPNRSAGILLAALAAMATLHGEALGLGPLLRYGAIPPVPHSDMAGDGQPGASARWFMLYWGLCAALLAQITYGLWRRGTAASLRARIRALPARLGRRGVAGALSCALLVLVTAGFLFHNTHRLNFSDTEDEAARWRAGYERAYKRVESAPAPSVVDVRADVELFPEQRRFSARGVYRLRNETARTIDTVWIAVGRHTDGVRLWVEGADPVVRDARFGMYGFRMRRPLAPGAETRMGYHLRKAQRGIRAAGFDLSVADNGTMLAHHAAFPTLGYRGSQELTRPADRREHGLSPRIGHVAGEEEDGPVLDRVTFETTVSTSADQIAVAPGERVGEWRRGGRRFFRYRMAGPVNMRFGYVSARYAVRRVVREGVAIEVYFHPGHAANVDRMLRTAAASVELFTRAFGPYPHRTLRIVEVPGYWNFGAYALPGMVYFPENRGFLTDARDPRQIDLVGRRVAHEVSHQWWGHQVNAGAGPGAATLTESLAKYSEQIVLERLHGRAHVARVAEADLERYAQGRTREREPEPPLARVTDQAHLYYGKGAVVMNGLRDLVGEDAMNRALQRLVAEHGGVRSRPQVRDLVRLLQDGAGPERRALAAEWLQGVVLYDLSADSAHYRSLGGGRYEVTAIIQASKRALGPRGEAEIPLDEALDLAVTPAEGGPAAVSRHRLRSGRNLVRVVVRGRPGEVTLDPNVLRVDMERRDNAVIAVEAPS
jgi:ABC-type transport system involved in multi-copper enzyme maturation permease subunit